VAALGEAPGAGGAPAARAGPAWRAWLLAARPRTLPVAVAPVCVGTALAAAEGRARAGPALAALAGALLLQIGANLANDLYDSEKGADRADRIGPPRARQQGLLSAAAMRRGIAAAFGAAALLGLYLAAAAGWPVLAIGCLSIAAGLLYTAGPWPLGYHGLGDLAVFVFFGVVAVCGSYYVQALALSREALAASLPVGCLATAILAVNNLRDLETDARAGKRTLAVRLGPRGARLEYAALVLLAFASLPALWLGLGASALVLLPAAMLPLALGLVRRVAPPVEGPRLNAVLAGTAQLLLAFSLLLSLGFLA
jgi:1,4-dihydroxy-2-naphthoate octaprenyltransferase